MGNNTKKRQIINICWKPFFVATMTGILAEKTSINVIQIGVVLGIGAAIACYFEIKYLLENEHENPSNTEKYL